MSATAQPEPQLPQVGPQPCAQQVFIQTAQTDDGKSFVVLQIVGPTGSYVSFLDPAAASAIAAQLEQAAAHARTGLIVAAGLEGLQHNGRVH